MLPQVHGRLWLNFNSHSGRMRTAAQVASRICSILEKHGIASQHSKGALRLQISLSSHDQSIFNDLLDEVRTSSTKAHRGFQMVSQYP